MEVIPDGQTHAHTDARCQIDPVAKAEHLNHNIAEGLFQDIKSNELHQREPVYLPQATQSPHSHLVCSFNRDQNYHQIVAEARFVKHVRVFGKEADYLSREQAENGGERDGYNKEEEEGLFGELLGQFDPVHAHGLAHQN